MLPEWSMLDTWIVVTAGLAAVACALPGTFLVLRRQSMLGDAVSHAILPGLVLAYLGLHALEDQGWMTPAAVAAWTHPALLFGAAITAALCGGMAEALSRRAGVDPGAALGVVYTGLFAFGLLLIRLAADSAHIDPGCVLYGNLETVVTDTLGSSRVPRAVLVNGLLVVINAGLIALVFKELQLCTFDPVWATTLGWPVAAFQRALFIGTGVTAVAAFESVGSILVLAMLVTPPACGILLSERLAGVLAWAVVCALVTAVTGHLAALFVPELLRWLFQWPELGDISTSGMMAVVGGLLFLVVWVVSPQQGLIRQWRDRRRLRQRILDEDILAALFRLDELPADFDREAWHPLSRLAQLLGVAERALRQRGLILSQQGLTELRSLELVRLTAQGRERARHLVRSHRLWETYLAHNLRWDGGRLHHTAEQLEHFIGPHERQRLADELTDPGRDPHGSVIPPE